MEELIFIIVIMIVSILALRFLGSWMFRIDRVIDELKKINKQLNK